MTVHLVKSYTDTHGALAVCGEDEVTMLATPEAVDQVTCDACVRPLPDFTVVVEGSTAANLTGTRPYVLVSDLAHGRSILERVSDGRLFVEVSHRVPMEVAIRWAKQEIRKLMNKGDL